MNDKRPQDMTPDEFIDWILEPITPPSSDTIALTILEFMRDDYRTYKPHHERNLASHRQTVETATGNTKAFYDEQIAFYEHLLGLYTELEHVTKDGARALLERIFTDIDADHPGASFVSLMALTTVNKLYPPTPEELKANGQ